MTQTIDIHPRPDFRRDTFASLDGTWSFAFDDADRGLSERWFDPGHALPLEINVPFCYQSELSGLGGDEIHPVLWYRRAFVRPGAMRGRRVLLRFGAVDWSCRVWVNGVSVGGHEGGYTPFALDITHALRDDPDAPNDVAVRVIDLPDRAQPRGKQYWRRGLTGCWYTPVSGIWQTVYLEAAASPMITRVHVAPGIDSGIATVTLALDEIPSKPITVSFGIDGVVEDGPFPERPTVCEASISTREASFPIQLRGVANDDPFGRLRLWSPRNPSLYGLTVSLGDGGDRVSTYFGMRKIAAQDGEVLLNNVPLYQRLVLDQGYWPKSLLTPPDDEAIIADIRWTLAFGFNGARKHQKIEVPRWYYWADKMGLLAWGELPSAYDYTPGAARALIDTMQAFIDRDFNHPCVIAWTPLNESWGVPSIRADKKQQDFARTLYALCKSLDGSRLVSGNDGWEQVETDIFALHDYTQEGASLEKRVTDIERVYEKGLIERAAWAEGVEPDYSLPFLLTEYGGIAYSNKGAQGEMGGMATWGYGEKMASEDAFLERFEGIQRAVYASEFCRGTCYTQLTDVQQEVNGLLSPERAPKVDPERFAALNQGPGR
ncbi:MAG: glycoside hydrolase family 2 [Oscillospiraceae bacterium]|nr:glycoside hydrolase family 2 [Oscillospiraceae bacterium]